MDKNIRKRKVKDVILQTITYTASFISVVILGAILFFVFSRGTNLLTFKIIKDDFNPVVYNLKTTEIINNNFNDPLIENAYFSKNYGIAAIDDITKDGNKTIRFIYIDKDSPLLKTENQQGELIPFKENMIFDSTIRVINEDNTTTTIFSRNGASNMINILDQSIGIDSAIIKQEGGGIRGSIITTLYLVFITLLIGLPLGIFTALYLNQIAPQNKITNILRSFIDMLTGVPSIIYGLMGAALFIPLTTKLFGDSSMQRGSLIAGSLTLVVIILPVVIKATESALDVVPRSYRDASLALGANKTQTTFKVMLPNALPGILSAALLSIGRIIGESAALIYAMGTIIGDNVSLTGRSTSLAVHIWAVMSGEVPNVALASTIAIIILVVVLSLNLLIKLITYRFTKRYK